MNIHSPSLIEESMKGADTVIYFSHDYFSLVQDKNEQLLFASKVAKEYNIEKFIAIAPIEFINYQVPQISSDPVKELNETLAKVQEIHPNTVVVRPDLVFGSNSYFIKFLMQSWCQSFSYYNSSNYPQLKFSPIYWNDMNVAIQTLIENDFENFKGKKYFLSGKETLQFSDIDNLIKQAYHEESNFTSPNDVLRKINESYRLFFHGNNHIINFGKMLNFLNGKEYNEGYEDLSASIDLKSKLKSFREYYSEKSMQKGKHLEEDMKSRFTSVESDHLTYPEYSKYWHISLN